MQRAAVVQGYRELAGVTDPAVAIGPAPARQAGMSEAFAASVRALELADDAAMVKAMGRGELEAQVREYARAEAVAPADISKQIGHSDGARVYTTEQAEQARAGGNDELARSAAALADAIAAEGEQMRIAQAARDEWTEATAPMAEAASQARVELGTRGTPRWDEPRPEAAAADATGLQAENEHEVQAHVDPAEAERWRTAQAELADLIREENRTLGHLPEAEREALPASLGDWMDQRSAELATADAEAQAETDVEAWPEAQAEMEADVDPEALTVMATVEADFAAIDDNLTRAQAGGEQLADERARNQAERDRAAVDEPVMTAGTQAELEAAAAIDKAEADQDADLEI
jgi:hypothetical protein